MKARGNAKKIKNILVLLIFVLPVFAQADPLLGKAMAGDRNLPRAFGIGIDYFSMDQPYQIDSLKNTPQSSGVFSGPRP